MAIAKIRDPLASDKKKQRNANDRATESNKPNDLSIRLNKRQMLDFDEYLKLERLMLRPLRELPRHGDGLRRGRDAGRVAERRRG